MVSPKIDYFVDFFMGIAFLFSVLSGIIMYALPWGSETLVLGLTRAQWPAIHEWSSFIMAGLVFVHLALHFRWIGSMTKSFFKKNKQ